VTGNGAAETTRRCDEEMSALGCTRSWPPGTYSGHVTDEPAGTGSATHRHLLPLGRRLDLGSPTCRRGVEWFASAEVNYPGRQRVEDQIPVAALGAFHARRALGAVSGLLHEPARVRVFCRQTSHLRWANARVGPAVLQPPREFRASSGTRSGSWSGPARAASRTTIRARSRRQAMRSAPGRT